MGKHNLLLKAVSNIGFKLGFDLDDDFPVLLSEFDISAVDLEVFFHYI